MASVSQLRQQLRAHLELERLFGISDVYCGKIIESPCKKNEDFFIFDLLVLLPHNEDSPKEKQLLQRMLATLEIEEKNQIIRPCHAQEIEELLKKFPARCILTMGQLVNHFTSLNLKDNFSCLYNKIPVFASHAPRHLLENPIDKKQSWKALQQLKNILKS